MSTSFLQGAGAFKYPTVYSRKTVGATIEPELCIMPVHPDAPDDLTAEQIAAEQVKDAPLQEARIRFAAGAIQTELAAQHYLKAGPHTGKFGPATDAAIRDFQRTKGLVADGAVGPLTMRALCWPVVLWAQVYARVRIPDNLLYGIHALESAFDPGAQGWARMKSTDNGIAQISEQSNPGITLAMACDIRFAIRYAVTRLTEGRRRGTDLQSYADLGKWDCAILDHNWPVGADALFDTGVWPLRDGEVAPGQAENYVRLVRKAALKAPAS